MAKKEVEVENLEVAEVENKKYTMKELKDAILNFVNSVKETAEFDGGEPYIEVMALDGFNWLKDLAKQIADSSERGLPLETRLLKAQTEQASYYKAVQVVEGLPVFSPEWIAENETLTAKIGSIKAQIKRRDAKKTDTAPVVETEKADEQTA